jgi:hypothetical protein
MRVEVKKRSGQQQRDTRAAFFAPRTMIYGQTTIRRKVVAEIHLVKGYFGGGTFAHELQHFIIWWSDIKQLEPCGKHWETIPKLVGDLTNEFWCWFYKEIEVV